MGRFLIRRLIQSVFILLGVSVLSYGLMRMAPGGLVTIYANPRIPQATIQRLEEQFGLNDPVPISYVKWLTSAVRGNFGISFIDQRPVVDKIAERLPATLQLSLAALLLGLLGIPLGVYAAMHRGSWVDNVIRVFTVVGNAVPHWWLGLMILVISANTIRIFPLGGMYTQGNDTLLDRLWHLALPATIAAMGGWIGYSRYMRSEVLDVLSQDFVRTARAKGLGERVILVRHVFRNALIPIVTLMGGVLAGLVGGSVLFENTFSWPGIGRMAVQAAFQRDYPVLMALNMFSAFLVILGNLIADVAYGRVDPRVRYEQIAAYAGRAAARAAGGSEMAQESDAGTVPGAALRRPLPVEPEARPSPGYFELTWRRLRRDRVSMFAIYLFASICLITVTAPLLATYVLHTDPNAQDLRNNFATPAPGTWLGTDELGRDNLTRVLYAGQVSLRIGFMVALVSLVAGVPIGLVAGFYGGRVDDAINAVIQVLQNIPLLFFLITLSITFRPDPSGLAVIIGLLGWMGTARLVRGQALSVGRRDYVDAARVLGARDSRILFQHILPNLISVVSVVAGFEIASGILFESGLSYLGLGVQPPTASWGNMLQNSLDYVTRAPWLVAAPGIMIFLTVLAIFLLADGLRDAFDPRMRG